METCLTKSASAKQSIAYENEHLLAALLGSAVLSGCNTTETTTTSTSGTTRAAAHGDANAKIINGQRYVYVRQNFRSNIPERWVPENNAEAQLARQAGTLDQSAFQKTQDMQARALIRVVEKLSR